MATDGGFILVTDDVMDSGNERSPKKKKRERFVLAGIAPCSVTKVNPFFSLRAKTFPSNIRQKLPDVHNSPKRNLE